MRGHITGERKSTESQASHNVGLFCRLDYVEYGMWVFVCLSLRGFKVELSGTQLIGLSMVSVWTGDGFGLVLQTSM